ncbi:MAG: restriction endonuclease subunit S, partial [Chloroflexi bacterium]|nr:restriction endonuclease subunit S [Chloroflexota bacterium]
MAVKAGYKQTEVGVIPEDWRVKELKDIADIRGGGTPSTAQGNFWDGGILWCTPTDITGLKGHKYLNKTSRTISEQGLKASSAELIPKHSIVMTSRATIGECAINDTPITTNQGFKNFIPEKDIDVEFLYYLLLTQKPGFISLSSGSTFLEIGKNQLKTYLVPLPPTLAEQEAIAAALSDADALIAALEGLIAKKRQIKQGAMQRFFAPQDNWVEKRLGETATLKARIGWQGLTTKEYLDSGEYYLITGTEFKNGFIDWANCHYVAKERFDQDKNIQVQENDVLVTKDGTIGKVALAKSLEKPATLNSGVFVIRPINDAFDPVFFYYLLLSDVFTNFLNQLSAGSTINHLYQKDFVNFVYQTPQTVEEQIAIAEILSDMDAEIEMLAAKLSKARQVKQ